MPEFLLTGRSLEGRKETVRVEAATADLAVKQFKNQGYSEIVLHTDDVGARYTHQRDVEDAVSPKEFVRFRNLGVLGDLLFVVRKSYAQGWYWHLAAIGVIAVRRYFGWPLGLLDIVAVIWLAIPLVVALGVQLFGSARRYNEVVEAISWGRWEEALRRLPAVRGKIPVEETAFIEAKALAGLGRLDEAIKVLKPFADGQDMPSWLYWGRIGDVYYAAGKYELIVPANEKAAELAPDNPTVLLDLAMALVRYRQDAVRARKLLQQARTHALSDVLVIFAEVIEGMIELESGNPSQARYLFDKSLAALAPFRNATPLIGAAIDRTYGYLCLAYAAMGDRDQALQYYRRAEPRMRALRSDDLIDRCEAALQLKPVAS
jgi:tetratricopeptide (TPR) repeat protein